MSNPTLPGVIPRPEHFQLNPFRALRYTEKAGDPRDLLAPPYDVIDAAVRGELTDRSPLNVARLTLPEPDGATSAYENAAGLLGQWRAAGLLVADDIPALYVYEQRTQMHAQRGLLGGVSLTPAEDQIVLPHENTMAGPVADRLALTAATAANLEPIFLVYDGGGAASAAVGATDGAQPLVDVTDYAGVRHRLWAITDATELTAIAADLAQRRAVIADGHHRYATYLRYQANQHEQGAGNGPWDSGLAFLVDSSHFGPEVHAIHRVVPGLAPETAIERARAGFQIHPIDLADASHTLEAASGKDPVFVLSDGKQGWLLSDPDPETLAAAMPKDRSAAWRSLHVSVAHNLLFSSLWGLDDREGVVDFVHDQDSALAAAADAGGVAILLAPTPVAAVAAVAAAGDRMPRKSTLFMPKPATGMAIRAFADQNRG